MSSEIDTLEFQDLDGRPRRLDTSLIDTYTDGMLVLHRGRVVYERYLGALERHLPHECQSCTKSYTGTLAELLVHEGALRDGQVVSHYLPELMGTAWEDATLRQVLDMQVAMRHSEEYAESPSDIWNYRWAFGRLPRPDDHAGPRGSCDYLRTIMGQGAHGDFAYQSLNTQVLAWVLMRVTGVSLPKLFQDRFWRPLGCDENGYLELDPEGMPLAEGGLGATLRDFARFGEMMRCDGSWQGRQIVPTSVVHDVRRGTGVAPASEVLALHGSYRSQWWVTNDEFGAFEARGIHGQRLYIAPKAEMVVARFGSHPIASGGDDAIVVPMMLALGRKLSG